MPLTPGVTVSNTLSPADSTAFYQFAGMAGQQLYFNGQPTSGFTYPPYCRLYAPAGNILFSTYVSSQVDTFTLPESGTYTFTTEGRVYDLNASGNYAFDLLPVNYVHQRAEFGANDQRHAHHARSASILRFYSANRGDALLRRAHQRQFHLAAGCALGPNRKLALLRRFGRTRISVTPLCRWHPEPTL